jgi:hypothetical protein
LGLITILVSIPLGLAIMPGPNAHARPKRHESDIKLDLSVMGLGITLNPSNLGMRTTPDPNSLGLATTPDSSKRIRNE